MDIYLARQPIFDRYKNVVGYELLHRSSEINAYTAVDGNLATSELISNVFFNIGLEKITRGKTAFINFTKQLLESETVLLLPKEHVTIEILEDIEPDEEVIEACRNLRKSGYTLALDDYTGRGDKDYRTLLALSDIVKVDLQNLEPSDRSRIGRMINDKKKTFLAEKVETIDDFNSAKELGFDLFQGFFFCKPVMLSSKSISASELRTIRLMQEIHRPEVDFDQIEALIKEDLSLSFMLLRCVNSLVYAIRMPVNSIRQAIALLGQKELIKWISLACLHTVGKDKPDELMITALYRAKFCESIALSAGLKQQSSEYFLTGLFSLLDTLFDRPMAEVLDELPLTEAVKEALLGKPGRYKSALEIALFYEQGDFSRACELAKSEYELDKEELARFYLDALQLADRQWV